MEIDLKTKYDKQDNFSTDQLFKGETQIFNHNFQTQNLDNPTQFLPQYQQQQEYQTSCVEDCNLCCGNLCIGCAYCFAFICCCKCSSCVYQLETSKAGLVEQFGRFNRLLKPGINMINPCTDQVTEVNLRINLVPAGRGKYMTKDNVQITVKSSIAFRITNPITAHYILGHNTNRALTQLTTSSLREVIGEQILDQVLTNRSKIVGEAKQIVKRGIPQGLTVERIFMQNINIPRQTVQDLSSAAKQRRISEANIINSQADVQTAKLMKQSAELLDTKAAMQIRYLEMVSQLGKKSCKVMLPIGIEKKGFKS